ncbi:MAG: hypothetical protein AUK44_05670 [Porphyromonadaceae bacterium CG2_30_38_12]|nr:MAG: hypothetical protein AUK44_05670 [Porphyromonadaceae bacterium CG2_30_38_12]
MRIRLVFLFVLLANFICSQNMDIDILRQLNLQRIKQADSLIQGITNSASPIAYGVSGLLLGLSFRKRFRHTHKKALFILLSVIVTSLVTTFLKLLINRPRPFVSYPFLEKMTNGGSPSFPSGHTSDAFSIATAISLAYPKWYVIIPAYMWAGAVAYSRMALGVHYPSDVLAGALLGFMLPFLFFIFLYRSQKNI